MGETVKEKSASVLSLKSMAKLLIYFDGPAATLPQIIALFCHQDKTIAKPSIMVRSLRLLYRNISPNNRCLRTCRI